MTQKKPPTELATWIDGYVDRAGHNIAQALHDLAQDLGLHDHEESADPSVPAVDVKSPNPAHEQVSTSRAHGHKKTRSSGTASDTESGAQTVAGDHE